MHIPDGFLSAPVCVGTGAVSAGVLGTALRRLRPEAEPALAPRMGLTAAYLFAAQMINFPVAAGTSGHLLGALLAAVLLGPHVGALVMAAVFLVQTFFFLDGGHTALGANILNMGLAGTYGGYAVYRAIAGPVPDRRRCLFAAGAAAWVSVMLGASLTAFELALSGTIAARLVFPAMLAVHAVIGLAEAAITAAALGLLWSVRPDLLTGRDAREPARARWVWAAAAGLALVAALAPLASSAPDGLEKVAGTLGFESRSVDPRLPGLAPDYSLPALDGFTWAPAAVSVLGAGIMLLLLAPLPRLALRSGVDHDSARDRRANERRAGPDPRVKLGCALALVLAAAFLPAQEAGKVLLLFLFAMAWVASARVSGRWLAGRAALLLPCVGLAALSSPIFHAGEGVSLSAYGLIFLRAATSLLATAAFVAATPEAGVLAALAAFRLPTPLAQTGVFALRYLRLLGDEAARMLQARAARTAGAGTLALRASVTGGIVGSLFIRSYERAERVALAMAARGGNRCLRPVPLGPLKAADWGFAAACALFLAGVFLWR